MDMRSTDVAVIVLNWNRRNDSIRCLESLRRADDRRIRVFVVDNASSDDSPGAIAVTFPEADIIINDRNLGYAEGNNVGIRRALACGAEWVMLLNNDTVVEPDAISLMLEAINRDDRVGVCAPAICYLNDPKRVWSAGGGFDWQRGTVTSDYLNASLSELPPATYEVDHVSGCAMLLRASAITDADLLDSRFFMYYEESEWCARIASAGYRIVVEPRAVIYHDIDPAGQLGSPFVAYYMTRNHLLFLRATRAPLRAWLYTIGGQVRTLGALFLTSSTPERKRGRVPMLRAMRDFALGRFGPRHGSI